MNTNINPPNIRLPEDWRRAESLLANSASFCSTVARALVHVYSEEKIDTDRVYKESWKTQDQSHLLPDSGIESSKSQSVCLHAHKEPGPHFLKKYSM